MSKNEYQDAYEPLLKSFNIRGWHEIEENNLPISVYYFSETLLELIIVTNELGQDLETKKYLNHFFM